MIANGSREVVWFSVKPDEKHSSFYSFLDFIIILGISSNFIITRLHTVVWFISLIPKKKLDNTHTTSCMWLILYIYKIVYKAVIASDQEKLHGN